MIANKKDKGETTTTIETVFSSDGKTAIKPVTTVDQIILSRPTLIVAFPGAGMVASISANYIIEQLQMHQIAYVDSEFAIPGIIYMRKAPASIPALCKQ
jgi:predicted ATP-grasp superfamily ATP-dependent carboligase